VEALIFDMDGVILDSEKHWKKAWEEFLAPLIDDANFKREKILGLKVPDIHKVLTRDCGLRMSLEDFWKIYEVNAQKIYGEKANLIDGIPELLHELEKMGIPKGLASSARKSWINQAVTRLKIEKYFKVILSTEEIKGPGKPAPDVYLEVAARLGVDPTKCLVIEDATNGVAAAHAAKMFTIGFRNGISGNQDLSKADLEIDSIRESTKKILEFFIK
jgi:HAD superfamily hydrolase (TIGR01509 family)